MWSNCEFFKEIDFYGKQPEFYFKGNPKKVTCIGRIFTFIYIFIYIVFFIYKLFRMYRRIDITFYDSYSDKGEIPSINITNENFYIAFSVFNGSTGEPFIDESIYYPVAYYKDNEIEEILELGPCNIDKIGSKYKEYFKEYKLDKYYCLNEVNHTLKAYINSFVFKINPCKNTSENNNHCKSKEIIDYHLNGNNLIIALEDILITPLKFDKPVQERINDLYTTLYKNFGQYLYIEMQMVTIETNNNIIGFDFLTKEKVENFIKYDTLEIIPQPGYDLNDENNNYPVCEIEFQLKDKILSEKRQYTQLIDVLGEVGGFMELISSFFGTICSFIIDILYEKSIVNNLFSFDIKKKIITIKNKEGHLDFKPNNERIIKDNNNSINQNIQKLLPTFDNIHKRNNNLIGDITNRKLNDKTNESIFLNKKKSTNIMETNPYKNWNEIENSDNQSAKNNSKSFYLKEANMEKQLQKSEDLVKEKNNSNEINYIQLNQYLIYLGFCFVRKIKNVNNVLLNEGMSIIKEKLDIFSLFRNTILNESIHKKFNCEHEEILFSDECSKNLKNLEKINSK